MNGAFLRSTGSLIGTRLSHAATACQVRRITLPLPGASSQLPMERSARRGGCLHSRQRGEGRQKLVRAREISRNFAKEPWMTPPTPPPRVRQTRPARASRSHPGENTLMNTSVRPAPESAPTTLQPTTLLPTSLLPTSVQPRTAMAIALAAVLCGAALPALAQSQFDATGRTDPADDVGTYVEGEEATAAGESSNAIGNGASVFGAGSLAFANWASAFGFNASALGENALAMGSQSYAAGASATAIGGTYVSWDGTVYYTQANDVATTAVGAGARADYGFGVALGTLAWSEGAGGVAIGANTHAMGFYSMAIGGNASTTSPFATAIGSFSVAQGWESAAFGNAALATDFFGTALGSTANATGVAATALGSYSLAFGDGNTAVGYHSMVMDWNDEHADIGGIVVNGTALGSESGANWEGAAFGYNAWARNTGSVAMGDNAWAQSDDGVAIGRFAQVTSTGTNSVAIGAGSVADRANTVSVGASADWTDDVTFATHTAIDRQITNVAAGTEGTDAVNLDQLTAVETKADTAMTAATNAQTTADTALTTATNAEATADTALTVANNAVTTAVTQANDYTDQQVAGVVGTAVTQAKAVADTGDAATLASARTYTDTTATQTLSSANAYTDARFAAWDDNLLQLRSDVEQRLGKQDQRIDRQGAMSAAMLNMATSAAGVRTQNRVGVGIGTQNGEAALSIGYQRAISDRATFTVGGAVSGDDSSIGVGAGFGW